MFLAQGYDWARWSRLGLKQLFFALLGFSLIWQQFIFVQPVEAAAITFINSASNNETSGSSTTITINKPTNTARGDVMVATIVDSAAGSTITSSGWTLIRKSNHTNGPSITSFYKVAGASEPTNYTFSNTSNVRRAGGIITYRNVDNVTPVDVTGNANSGSSTSVTALSVTTSASDTMLVYSGGSGSGVAVPTYTPPSGMTERVDVGAGGILGNTAVTMAEQSLSSSGSTGNKSATASQSGDWAAHLFALEQAPPPSINQSAYRFSINADNDDPAFAHSNPSSGDDTIEDTVIDPTNSVFYAVGYTSTNWVIEKRRVADGSLCTSTNCGTTFGTNGQIIQDVASSADEGAYGAAVDPSDGKLYVVGYDKVGGTDKQWRIEKRDMSTGALDTSFDSDGVVQSDGDATADDVPIGGIVLDTENNYIYVAGYDGAGNNQWRIEKRRMSDGALCTAANCGTDFGTGGVFTLNISGGDDRIGALEIDPTFTYLYVAGFDTSNGNTSWRVDKRRASDAALCTAANCGTAFDTDGIWTSNPTSGGDQVTTMKVDTAADAIYVAGYDNGNGRQWRIEKISQSTGAYITAFGSSGVVTSNPSSGSDEITDLDLDGAGGFLYVMGTDANGTNQRWRVEKRQRSDGGLVTGWASSGIANIDPHGTNNDPAKRIVIDIERGLLWAAGGDRSLGTSNMRWHFAGLTLDTGTIWLAPANNVGGISSNVTFRLRLLLHITEQNLFTADNLEYKLQYSPKVGTCDTGFIGESYADVTTSSGDVRYHDNPTISDGANIVTKSGQDPTHGSDPVISQRIEESNTFTNANNVYAGEDGLWDFVLKDVDAFGAYCFRVVDNSNATLASYTQVPEITFCKDDPKTEALLRHGNYFCEGTERSFFWSRD